jgi:hypothetical protein
MLIPIQDIIYSFIPRFNHYLQLMQLTQLSGSSYSLSHLVQHATTTTRVTHKTIIDLVKLQFILKDQVSRLYINLKLCLSLGQLMPKSD